MVVVPYNVKASTDIGCNIIEFRIEYVHIQKYNFRLIFLFKNLNKIFSLGKVVHMLWNMEKWSEKKV